MLKELTKQDKIRSGIKPRSPEVMAALERSKKLAEKIKKLSKEEQDALFFKNLEEIRAEAIAKGVAIEDEKATG